MDNQTKKLEDEKEVEIKPPEAANVETKRLSEEELNSEHTGAVETTLPVPQSSPDAVLEDDRLMALLAYIVPVVVPSIILLNSKMKARAYQKYHAMQSLGLSIVSLIFVVALTVINFAISALCCPLACISGLLYFAPLVLIAYYGYMAYEMRDFDIPFLTEFMLQNGWL